jgi:glycosyltransferase 2 family protein
MTSSLTKILSAALIKTALGYLLAFGGLAWVLHDIDWMILGKAMTDIRWIWVAPALLFDIFSYVSQGWRWQLLLKPQGNLSILRSTQAIYAGLFINEILPMRLGEIARAFLVARWMEKDFTAILPSMAVERLQDAVWLVVSFGLAAIFVPLPENLLRVADILGMLTFLAVIVFVLLVTHRPKKIPDIASTSTISAGIRSSLSRLMGTFTRGFRQIGLSPAMYGSLFISFLLLLFQALAYWILMPACGLKTPFWTGMVIFLIVHVGTAIPNAPANIGSYQFFTVLGLTLFGEDKTAATAFSLVAFFLLTFPLWFIGFLALSQSGSSLKTLRQEIDRLSEKETVAI